ncbi:MAG: ABC transporter permease [Anaerolineae bacterium]|uniref:ABC transporter permease n=1 Tax=Candidatus Desulfolinea nitratireducens TaxID=2841698 RepID=A0A8J6TEH4_9CHLR|nr:ABC transporter permease [Candidatus Desulfolinea nitratireducens]MBL6960263.1 ABC transporter permease [Anaerolineales bacterium]NQU30240.1 ABC transporter permease [Anaerolineae bacterium]
MNSNEKTLNIIGEVSRPPETMGTLAWKRFRRHPGAMVGSILLILLILAAVFANLSPYDPEVSDIKNRYQAPSLEHPFGTDGLGRDLLTRTLYGGRVSMLVGLMVVSITLSIGVPVGSIAGYYGGWIDNVLMRIIDATLSIPSLMFLILLSAILRETDLPFVKGNSVMTIAVVLGALSWPTVARLVRAVFLTVREMEYVKAAQALGASAPRIVLKEILPNGFGPIIVESTLGVGYAIMEESGLSFLGFGIMPPTPSWGNMLNNAQEHLITYPWLAIFPGLMIFLTIISVNYIGDGLRDALDPYKVLGKVE